MRHSRGMGDMNPAKLGKRLPKKITAKDDCERSMKKGGGIKSVDRLEKQTKGADKIGKRRKSAENFGNLSKYFKGK